LVSGIFCGSLLFGEGRNDGSENETGRTVLDVPNYGRYADFAIAQAHSTVYSLIVFGEPIR
jgi:hypothetical protein